MIRIQTTMLSILGIVAVGAPAHAAVAVTSATVHAGASAIIISGKKFDVNEKDKDANLADGKKSVNAAVTAVNQDAKNNRAFDHEDVFANFVSPTSGTVDFSGSSTSSAISGMKIVEGFNSGSSFNYDFTITRNYDLNLSYFASETDSFYPDNYLQVINTSGGPPLFSVNPADGTFDNPTVGSASVFLTPGSYELGITSKLGDLSGTQGAGYSVGSHAEQYTFNLASAVPELSTWMMMIGGIGFIGGITRRARSSTEKQQAIRAPAIA